MATFAVTENGAVINVIVADSKETAEQITGLECVEYTDEDPLVIGATWNEEWSKYVNPCGYASHVYNGTAWVPPIPMPEEENKYFLWDEESLSWISFDMVNVRLDQPEN